MIPTRPPKRPVYLSNPGMPSLSNLADLLTSCAFTARYRPTALATNGSLPPDHLAIVTISATEHRQGQRRPFFEDTPPGTA